MLFRSDPEKAIRVDYAKWLPLFEENFCGSASSLDAGVISEIFGTPVLAFSIFDSDILFVSYRDPEKAIRVDYAKPNFEEFEEYDDRLYKAEFPQFLCAYGDEQLLREIWEGEEVFADDRMLKLCEVIGAQVLYVAEELPEGYERVE